jgi:hypothetical protein
MVQEEKLTDIGKQEYAKKIQSEMSQKALKCTVGFYSGKIFFGTGFLYKISDRRFCATAKHVIEDVVSNGKAWVNINKGYLVPGKVYKSSDTEDIAFFEFDNDLLGNVSNKIFLDLTTFDPAFRKKEKEFLLLTGFSCSTQKLDHVNKRSNVSFQPYGTITPDKKPIWTKNYSIELFCPDFSTGENMTVDDQPILEWDFAGNSGCPIWDTNMSKNRLDDWHVEKSKIIGIFHKWYDKDQILRGTLISTILIHMAKKFPELVEIFDTTFSYDWNRKLKR